MSPLQVCLVASKVKAGEGEGEHVALPEHPQEPEGERDPHGGRREPRLDVR